ncbi:metal ABC transporter solute-binding protein, Zn/Mn family, partial [Streptococcus suis]
SQYTETLTAAKQKYFVTQHTAFAYLALDYGLKQVSITGVAADEDPTPTRLAELTEYIKQYGIKYIYFEENASKSVAETLVKETGVQLDVLNPLESLTDED